MLNSERLIAEAQRKISALYRALDSLHFIPEELLDEAYIGDHLELCFCYDLELIAKVRAEMTKRGWEEKSAYRSTFSPIQWIEFKRENLHATARFDGERKGSRCKVNVLVPKVEGVYEIVCEEAEDVL